MKCHQKIVQRGFAQCLQWVYGFEMQNLQYLQPSLRVYDSQGVYTPSLPILLIIMIVILIFRYIHPHPARLLMLLPLISSPSRSQYFVPQSFCNPDWPWESCLESKFQNGTAPINEGGSFKRGESPVLECKPQPSCPEKP